MSMCVQSLTHAYAVLFAGIAVVGGGVGFDADWRDHCAVYRVGAGGERLEMVSGWILDDARGRAYAATVARDCAARDGVLWRGRYGE